MKNLIYSRKLIEKCFAPKGLLPTVIRNHEKLLLKDPRK